MVKEIVYDKLVFGDDTLACEKKIVNIETMEMLIEFSGSISHMVNSVRNMTNL